MTPLFILGRHSGENRNPESEKSNKKNYMHNRNGRKKFPDPSDKDEIQEKIIKFISTILIIRIFNNYPCKRRGDAKPEIRVFKTHQDFLWNDNGSAG